MSADTPNRVPGGVRAPAHLGSYVALATDILRCAIRAPRTPWAAAHPRGLLSSVMHGDRGPGTEVDAVAVVHRQLEAGRDVIPVELRAIGRTGVDDRPAVRGGDQDGVQAADSWVGGRAGEVNLRINAAGRAAPTDAHLG